MNFLVTFLLCKSWNWSSLKSIQHNTFLHSQIFTTVASYSEQHSLLNQTSNQSIDQSINQSINQTIKLWSDRLRIQTGETVWEKSTLRTWTASDWSIFRPITDAAGAQSVTPGSRYSSCGICPALASVPLLDFLELRNRNVTLHTVGRWTVW